MDKQLLMELTTNMIQTQIAFYDAEKNKVSEEDYQQAESEAYNAMREFINQLDRIIS